MQEASRMAQGCRRKVERMGALLPHSHALLGVQLWVPLFHSFASPIGDSGACVNVVKPLPWVIDLAENLAVVESFLGLFLEQTKSL